MSQTRAEGQCLPSATAPTGDGSPTAPWSVSRVRPEDLMEVWPRLLPGIWRGLRRGAGDSCSEDGLFYGIIHRDVELWLAHRGDAILAGVFLQIDKRERGKALVVLNV